jgi:hypothetical protein
VTEDSGYASLMEGRRLHMRRRWASAERAYREAIAEGRLDGWLMLGLLLQPWPGREHEAEAAFRSAMADDHLDTRTRAASELGFMLAVLERDLEGARDCFAYVAEHGSGRRQEAARAGLGRALGALGDRGGATEAFRAVFVERYRVWNIDAGEDEPLRFAGAMAGLFLRPRSRRLFQRLQAARYSGQRLRRRLIPGR